MRRAGWCAVLLLSAAGCVTTEQSERLRAFSEEGAHLYSRGDFAHARECFDAARALAPGDANLLYDVAQCYDRQGQDERAEPLYRDCLTRSPDHAECRHALAALLVREGRWPDATQLVNDWVTRRPKLATAYAEDAWLWRQYGDLPQARLRVEEALALDPHDNRALLEKAQIYEALHRPDRALFLYEQALQYKPGQADVVKRVSLLKAEGADRPHPD